MRSFSTAVPAGKGQSRITLGDMDTGAAACGLRYGDHVPLVIFIGPEEILQPHHPAKAFWGWHGVFFQ